ncbi:uncharacterized protein L969DRAFT_97218 [Mixia osmundae IAM 14324]|uniref:MARVEL domain-containing protein n=1 Tax=Mixia osmundae (strain CBS 9802 / IAM 14324 / JCM 22182 / KY 12970) TaxID=764103 RepID=G7DW13_MIXOS|nr:uncharacterized protein L969DRAFT_97218 [Mixia osmundae IAM 14324]KEI36481.1 hypothetical protein L969DRAFT_97218 [Mixia osmundae IAM 14324]GAA94819.1 hypothetical protein E5Q_01473 [Mixia osmundae IAM 14324]
MVKLHFGKPTDQHAYLHIPRALAFQATSATSIVVVGISSYGLVFLNDKKKMTAEQIPEGVLHAQEILNTNGSLTAASGFASLLCTVYVLMTILRIHPIETKRSIMIKEFLFGLATLFLLGANIAMTVVTSTKSATITTPLASPAVVARLVAASGQNLAYISNWPPRVAMIVGWVNFACMSLSWLLVSLAARHMLRSGHNEVAVGNATLFKSRKAAQVASSGVDSPNSMEKHSASEHEHTDMHQV